MKNLVFNSTVSAFEYATEYFSKEKLSLNSSYIGIVRLVENDKEPPTFLIEIICQAGNLLSRKKTQNVAAIKHPDLNLIVGKNDLVIFAPTEISSKVPAGYVLYKLKAELDDQSKQFKKYEVKSVENSQDQPNADRILQDELQTWKLDLDYKYGLLLPESELLEDGEQLYFCQTDRKRLCAAWNKKKKTWEVNVNRSMLDGLSFSTPKRFEQEVFGKNSNQEGYLRKQYLITYLLFGLGIGEIKTLTKKVDNEATIEFSIEGRIWNDMLVGNPAAIENGKCKYFEKNSTDERILHFAMLCDEWQVTIEFLIGGYENYEQHSFGIKHFDNFYG
jgi:hypothetical protein